jgi:hypothetical protein
MQYIRSFSLGTWINFIPKNTCKLITTKRSFPFFESEDLGGVVTSLNIFSIQIICHRFVFKF